MIRTSSCSLKCNDNIVSDRNRMMMHHDVLSNNDSVFTQRSSNDLTTWSERHPYLSRSPAWAAEGTQGGAPGAPIKISQRDDGESVLLRNSANTSANTSANRSALKIFFMMTFQAEQRECNRRVCTCIGAAFAPHPSQPFVPADTPVTCMPQLDGAIDSSPRRLAMADGAGTSVHLTLHRTLCIGPLRRTLA